MRVLESVYDRSSDDIATAVEMLLNHKHLILQDSETVPAAIDLFVHAPVSVFRVSATRPASRSSALAAFDRSRLAKMEGAEWP